MANSIGRWNMPASNQTQSAETQAAELQRLTAALALAERDRQLLGYEIHDGVVQDLSAAAMYLEGAGREAKFASAAAQENFAASQRLLRETIAEARRLIRGLATVELDQRGLVSALERLSEKFRTEHLLPVDFSSSAAGLHLPASAQHLLLRIAQESLYNVWKHAQARSVRLRLLASDHQLELLIADDGTGFNPAQIPAGHFGLAGMRARAEILAAQLKIESGAGQGTRVALTMPLP